MKSLSPRAARNTTSIRLLNCTAKKTRRAMLMVGASGETVLLARIDSPHGETMLIPRKDFEALINWYQRPQLLKEQV